MNDKFTRSDSAPKREQKKKANEHLVIDYKEHKYLDLANFNANYDKFEYLNKYKGKFQFLLKLHDMLENFPLYITWLSHGRAFRISVPKRVENFVCDIYFDHKRLLIFRKQLINWGFKHVTRGRDRNSYYHESFLRGRPHLCQQMTFKTRFRERPHIESEPSFYDMAPLL